MKKYIPLSLSRIGYSLFLLAGSLFFLSSCEEEDPTAPLEASAPPAIEAVRATRNTDSTFQKATLGSTIVIVGQNLAATQYVVFNGYQTTINPAYATNTHLIVRIPDLVPTVATAGSVANELKVVNAKGEATYQFEVLPPPPIVERVSNEYVKGGEMITLYGNYFYFVKEVTFPGDIIGTDVMANADGKSLTVKVPAGVDATKGDIVVTSESGNSATNRRTRLYSYGIVSNFDDINPFGWGIDASKAITTTAPGITPLDNKFALVNMALPGDWGWSNDKVINLVDYGGKQIFPIEPANLYNPADPIGNFEAKMEVAVSNTASLEGIILQVMAQDANDKELTANVNLKDFISSTDGTWYTVSVPLSNLANGDAKLSKYGDLLKGNKGGQKHYRAVIINTTSAAVPVTIAIDNMRIVNTVAR